MSKELFQLSEYIRIVPDFPKKGIQFQDITTVLKDGKALQEAVDGVAHFVGQDYKIDGVIGPESRGFIFGVPVAYKLGCGFIPARKPGKLPAEVISQEYDLEYGSDTIEIHKDAIKPGGNYVIVDDLLATGGTARAIVDLVTGAGGNVLDIVFFIELADLGGRKLLRGVSSQFSIKIFRQRQSVKYKYFKPAQKWAVFICQKVLTSLFVLCYNNCIKHTGGLDMEKIREHAEGAMIIALNFTFVMALIKGFGFLYEKFTGLSYFTTSWGIGVSVVLLIGVGILGKYITKGIQGLSHWACKGFVKEVQS